MAEQSRNITPEQVRAPQAPSRSRTGVRLRTRAIFLHKAKEFHEVFDLFDEDGNRTLSKEEFHNCVTANGLIMTEEKLSEVVGEIGDSSLNGEISFEKFASWMAERHTRASATKENVVEAMGLLAANGGDELPVAIEKGKISKLIEDEQLRSYVLDGLSASEKDDDAELPYHAFVGSMFDR